MQAPASASVHLSVNQLSAPLLLTLLENASQLRIGVTKHELGCIVVDAGIAHAGSLEAGRLIAELCLGGLARVQFETDQRFNPSLNWPTAISVTTEQPVLACLASQYAGWALSHEGFYALGSGPARALAQREALFAELAYQDAATSTCLVLETDRMPPEQVIAKVLQDTQVPAANLTVILTPTTSMAGVVQIVARVLEVALHKAHTLHFPLGNIIGGSGLAVLPPVAKDFMTAMGRTNDAILFGGTVNLLVDCDDAAAQSLASHLPSCASKDYGLTFAEVFKAANMDFYKIDPMLFSPAQVVVTNRQTGAVFEAGRLNAALLMQSFTD
jgi:methenyltetrahydromethanopterin cyclohydrolase